MKNLGIALILICVIGIGLLINKDRVVQLRPVEFTELPQWADEDTRQSFSAFKKSCDFFLKKAPDQQVGSALISLRVREIRPACQAALMLDKPSKEQAHVFFESWFRPFQIDLKQQPMQGLITGYYLPRVEGRLTKTSLYSVPIYGMPQYPRFSLYFHNKHVYRFLKRLNALHLLDFYTRKDINAGAIDAIAPVIAWVKSPIDRLFIEIQGSGELELEDGSSILLSYAGQNGAPYTAIASILIKKKVLTPKNQSMQEIRHYLETHPNQIDTIINQNESFVFFKKDPTATVVGVYNIPLTAGYSLAVDRHWIPIGLPLWLTSTVQNSNTSGLDNFQRLMIAQDVGGAIRGTIRGDVFFGSGEYAAQIAGHMKSQGRYWILLPKS